MLIPPNLFWAASFGFGEPGRVQLINDALERQTFRYGCIEVDVRFFRLHYVRAKVARR